MAEIDTSINVIARCHECGEELEEYDVSDERGSFGKPDCKVLIVEPCEYCINEARESREGELKELTDRIAELTAELEETRNV